MVELKSVANIKELENSSILYQKNYSAIASLKVADEELNIEFEFMIEMNPISFNYYIKKIFSDVVKDSDFKNLIIPEIQKLHETGKIDFDHSF